MKRYKEFYHVGNYDRSEFEEILAEKIRQITESGHGIEVQYHPVYNGYGITFCALVLEYVEE